MGWVAGIGIMALMVPTIVDVSYRGFFGPSVPGMVEFSEIGLVIVIFLGIGSAMTHGHHIHTPILTQSLPSHIGNRLLFLGRALMWVLILVILIGTIREAADSFAIREYRFGLVEVPIWPAKAVIPLGFAALLIEITIQLLEYGSRLSGKPITNDDPHAG
jgi:TRAP-type C4-dicarboxylate transport system permease small subunit